MLLKLAVRNIRRSVRDYLIYFVTLLFGVALFYTFNSIESQQVLFDMEETASANVFEVTQYVMNMFSGVIACVLGFLVLYSNRFLIRRRKREFGTYEVLGMMPSQVARIMLYETLIVGVASLVLGLLLGVLLSQGLSFVTGAMFGTTIKNYQFVFSSEAFMLTLICFVIIFAVLAVFNTVSVGRYRLITLLQAESQNEKAPVRNQWACLVVFIVSIAVLAFAYQQLIESGMVMLDDPRFLRATVAMLVGSLLFFWSLAGFVIALLTRLRGVYLRGLRPFTVRQIASKVNTAFVSLWAVCVLLFFSITTFSVGMGLVEVFVGDAQKANPYSATASSNIWSVDLQKGKASRAMELDERAQTLKEMQPALYEDGVAHDWSMAQKLQQAAPELWEQTIGSYGQVNNYEVPGLSMGSIVDRVDDPEWQKSIRENDTIAVAIEQNVQVISLEEFNTAREMQGQQPVAIGADECALVNNMAITQSLTEGVARSGAVLNVSGADLTVRPEIYDTQLYDSAMLSTAFVIVVPDEVVANMKAAGAIPNTSSLNMMYADNGLTDAENDVQLARIVAAAQPVGSGATGDRSAAADIRYGSTYWPVNSVYTAHEMITQSFGLRMMITYLALYIGLVFLLSTAAILAVQQMSETVDSQNRYRMLWRLGCDARMINRSLLAQVLVYFLAPLGLAVCHSACAIWVLSNVMFDAWGVPVLTPILMASVFTSVIYGAYLLITYFASRSVLKPILRSA